jgi:hypothetical protein
MIISLDITTLLNPAKNHGRAFFLNIYEKRMKKECENYIKIKIYK